jgi:hypothetical protein
LGRGAEEGKAAPHAAITAFGPEYVLKRAAELVRRRHPRTAILFASGDNSEHVRETVIGPDAMLILKPYSLGQLSAKVREALDPGPLAPS